MLNVSVFYIQAKSSRNLYRSDLDPAEREINVCLML